MQVLRHNPLPLRTIFVILLFISIIGYSLFEARRYLVGPQISIEYPEEGQYTVPRLITLTAKTKNIASISINGRPVYITEDGLLQEQLLLQTGYTILTIAAKDRFGHETKKELELYTIDNENG